MKESVFLRLHYSGIFSQDSITLSSMVTGLSKTASIPLVTGLSKITLEGLSKIALARTRMVADGMVVPWLCSQTDMLAEDWQEL